MRHITLVYGTYLTCDSLPEGVLGLSEDKTVPINPQSVYSPVYGDPAPETPARGLLPQQEVLEVSAATGMAGLLSRSLISKWGYNGICIYTYIHSYIHTHFTYTHTYRHTYNIHTYVHTYILYIHTYIQTYIHACIHTYKHTYIHAYTHTYIHTYMHAYIHN